MRINKPVTNNEYVMSDDEVVISKTNLKGQIVYTNKTFRDIAQFTEEELMGKAHNIVRHPDMPPEAFEDLWATLKKGKAWTGYVKNRCKNGDYYWVEANANPIRDSSGQVTGYMSLRLKPPRETVKAVDKVYRRFREGKAGHLRVFEGAVIRKGILGWLGLRMKPTIRGKLFTSVALLVLMAVGAATLGLNGMQQANDALGRVYNDRVVPLEDIKIISDTYAVNVVDTAHKVRNGNLTWAEGMRNAEQAKQIIDQKWNTYLGTVLVAEEERLVAEIKPLKRVADEHINELVNFIARKDKAGLANWTISDLYDGIEPVSEKFSELTNIQLTVARDEYESAQELYATTRNTIIISIVVGILIALTIAWMVIRGLITRLAHAQIIAEGISSGDMTQHVDIGNMDEVGTMLKSLRNVMGNLRGIVRDVTDSATAVNSAASEIAAGNTDLSSRTEEQASSLEETASSMEEMTSTVKQNADNARQANQLAASARDQATQGGEVVRKAVTAMGEINSSSKKIADIIGVIDEIAFQTNLLALNAAVEAARAGEQGRGFAVVAGEVRTLAQRSAEAAKEIKGLIADSVGKVEHGSALVDESGKTLDEIVDSVKKVTDIVSEIAAASSEQSSGIDQINKAITQMDDVTQQNAALVEEAAAASKSLEESARDLSKLTGFFTIGGSSVSAMQHKSAPSKTQSGGRQATASHSAKSTSPRTAPAAVAGDDWEEF